MVDWDCEEAAQGYWIVVAGLLDRGNFDLGLGLGLGGCCCCGWVKVVVVGLHNLMEENGMDVHDGRGLHIGGRVGTVGVLLHKMIWIRSYDEVLLMGMIVVVRTQMILRIVVPGLCLWSSLTSLSCISKMESNFKLN
jgi:hypothetical protein